MTTKKIIKIGSKEIGPNRPAYLIAEVGSNFDNDFLRVKKLALMAKQCGAQAYKIQNFLAPKIVSAQGFQNKQVGFQAAWQEPVANVYRRAEFPREWLPGLSQYCRKIGIDFLSSPYDKEAVDQLEKINILAYKIGSGEIDNLELLKYVAKTKKPILLAVGAATLQEIEAALKAIYQAGNEQVIILQCVTNYPSPIADANLRAMVEFGKRFNAPVGYSDHTIGQSQGGDDPLAGLTVPLGAIALGACVIEKHFTDDKTRKGPDHPFSMELKYFKKMAQGIRAMETALGDGQKRVMDSEKETVIIQRRGLYAKKNIKKNEIIAREMIDLLRPAIGLRPQDLPNILGRKAKREIAKGQAIQKNDI